MKKEKSQKAVGQGKRDEAKKSKTRDFQLLWGAWGGGGAERDDVNQGFLNLTFNNQVMIKLDEYKNLEIPAVACKWHAKLLHSKG